MWDLCYKKFSSVDNLKLAWMRIKTAENVDYKNYYRSLLLAYEITVDDNLTRLSERLNGGSYNPLDILRFYIPKSSGLQRPLTFLHLDDMIVYQAFGNVILNKFSEERKNLEKVNVFSNLINRDENKIFMFKKWKEGFKEFIRTIKKLYRTHNEWVAHFDLASYFDTIDHEVLANLFSNNSYDDFTNLFCECLKSWSTHKNNKLSHGIPQGPITSNLLGELYLLPIDKKLSENEIKYVRYVDDIKIYGKSREEVLKGIIILEKECKELGLIPHSRKYEIIEASNIQEATGRSPSLQNYEKKIIFSEYNETFKMLKIAFDDKNFSKIKYILKVTKKDENILNLVLNNLNKYPELTNEFFEFLIQYWSDTSVGESIYYNSLYKPSIYEYTEGKYWELLSYFKLKDKFVSDVIKIAVNRINNNKFNYSLKLGLYKFFCSKDGNISIEYLKEEDSSLIKMMVMDYLPVNCLKNESYVDLLNILLEKKDYEPILVSLKEVISNNKLIILNKINLSEDYSGIINNFLGNPTELDSVGQIIRRRFKVPYSDKWKELLNSDYNHANNVINLANKAYYMDRNSWVNYTDAFNDILIRKLIDMLKNNMPHHKWPSLIGKDNRIVDFGNLLDSGNRLSFKYPTITMGLRNLHMRRRETLTSHAYEKKTKQKTKVVSLKEQKKLHGDLKASYGSIINLIEKIY